MKGIGLTQEQKSEIRRLHRKGVKNIDIASKFMLHTKTVERVLNPKEQDAVDKCKFTQEQLDQWDATRLMVLEGLGRRKNHDRDKGPVGTGSNAG